MRVLITGATGFVGSHLVDRCLAMGDTVRVLVRKTSNLEYLSKHPGLEYVYGDLSDQEAVRQSTKGIDTVYHSAARVTEVGDRRQFLDDNYFATKHLVDEAKRQGVKRFIFVSSPSIFFDFKEQDNINESYPYPHKYINLYSETKALAEQYVLGANDDGFVACALRPRGVWGPRDKTGYIPKILNGMRMERFPDISGGKKVLATVCHVENVAEACVLAARSDKVGGKAYFVTDDEIIDAWEFLRIIARKLKIPLFKKKMNARVLMAFATMFDIIWKIPSLARKSAPPLSRYSVGLLILTSTYDISAAKKDFGYSPKINQKKGIEDLVEWIEKTGGIDVFLSYVNKAK